MCFEDFGVEYFRNYKFLNKEWTSFKNDDPNFIVKKSSIPNSGNGLYLRTKTLKPGQKILTYQGEPLETWQYEALDFSNEIYNGVTINIPKLGKCVWKGIPKTMGTYINSVMKDKDANVEFVLDFSQINHKLKTIHPYLVSIYTKKEIKPGEELFLYYGSDFWKIFKNRNEKYCVLCISFDSHLKNLMLLCDGCGHGFHEKCLLKHNHKKERIPKGNWFCFNCK